MISTALVLQAYLVSFGVLDAICWHILEQLDIKEWLK